MIFVASSFIILGIVILTIVYKTIFYIEKIEAMIKES